MKEDEFNYVQQIIAESEVERLYIELSKLREEKKNLLFEIKQMREKCQKNCRRS